jgi:hypothetical protein
MPYAYVADEYGGLFILAYQPYRTLLPLVRRSQ